MKCTELLIQEHKVILRALDVLDHMARRIGNDQPVATADVETLLRFLREFGDNNHQTKEESAFFPELLRNSSGSNAPLHHMIFEHDQERSLVEGLEDALYTKKGSEFVQFAERLASLIRNHIYKEDHVLFEIAEHSLSVEQDEQIIAQLDKFHVEPSILAELRRLEWSYLGRAAA